jgi:hypothetical protein
MKTKKVKCEFCNIPFNRKGIGAHLRFCKAKKEAQSTVQYATRNEEAQVDPNWQEVLKLRREIDTLKHQLNRAKLTLNGYRETLGAAGRLLASLVDVSEIN